MLRRLVAVAFASLLGAACAKDDGRRLEACVDPPAPATDKTGLTWHRDVRPIVEGRCSSCHVVGGGGPFPLTTYAQVFSLRNSIRGAVKERVMPPFPPARCCREYHFDRSLTDAEISTVVGWIDQGAPEGDPAQVGAPLSNPAGISRVDVRVTMPEPYTPRPPDGSNDDTRCFVMDWQPDETTFVTGLNVKPGVNHMVHHVILALASGDDLEAIRAIDARDDRPGFDCNGGFGGVRVTGTITGWEPGETGVDIPDGMGVKVEAKSRLILNIHYSLAYSPAVGDQTTVELKLDREAKEFRTAIIANPLWLVDGAMTVKAGSPDTSYHFAYDAPALYGTKGMKVVSVNLHMHDYGVAGRVGVLRKGGGTDCILEIPKWDLHWMGFYWLKEPITLNAGDRLYLECQFDNSPSNRAVAAGRKQDTPHDIDWGGDEDMCAAFVGFVEQ